MKELQSLKETVNKLKSGCQECCGAQGNEALGYERGDRGQAQGSIQRDAEEGIRQDLMTQGGFSQEERGDGTVPGATVEGTGLGHGAIYGKIPSHPRTVQDMQVRNKIQRFSNTKTWL